MDQNKPTTTQQTPGQPPPVPSATAPVSQQNPTPQPVTQTPVQNAQPQQPRAGASKKGLLFLLIFVALAVIVGIIAYTYVMNARATQEQDALPEQPAQTTSVQNVLPEEQELETIDVGDIDQDVNELEQDAATL